MNMSAAEADRLGVTYPNKIMREMTNWNVFRAVDQSPERFDALERAGFKLERKGDIYDNLYCRFGGHYVDIGTSARIAKGEIKMKGEAVKGWTEDGLRFEDGSEVKADLVVLCTGFDHDFRKAAKSIIGDVADQVDDYFGIDEEGEVRGAFKTAGRKLCPTIRQCDTDLPRSCTLLHWRRYSTVSVHDQVYRSPDSSWSPWSTNAAISAGATVAGPSNFSKY